MFTQQAENIDKQNAEKLRRRGGENALKNPFKWPTFRHHLGICKSATEFRSVIPHKQGAVKPSL